MCCSKVIEKIRVLSFVVNSLFSSDADFVVMAAQRGIQVSAVSVAPQILLLSLICSVFNRLLVMLELVLPNTAEATLSAQD